MGCVMESYKIRVNNEAGADEARDLFKKLGYYPDNSSYEPYVEWIAVFEDGSGSFYRHNMNLNECVEITIAQLRDLVVLKRNDVRDANYKSATDFYYVTVENQYYFWNGFAWCLSDADFIIGLSPIIDNQINQDPALISGAEAMIAAIDGKDVEYDCTKGKSSWSSFNDEKWSAGELKSGKFKFRLKPQTIKLELELPKPFEPKEGEKYWIISDDYETGYTSSRHPNITIGAWRTEDEIKKVVEQLRKIKGAV